MSIDGITNKICYLHVIKYLSAGLISSLQSMLLFAMVNLFIIKSVYIIRGHLLSMHVCNLGVELSAGRFGVRVGIVRALRFVQRVGSLVLLAHAVHNEHD